MPDSNVSSCVLNILGSFSSSLALHKRLKERKGPSASQRSKKSDKKAAVTDEERRLSHSLRRGPEDISREYQRNVYAVGDQYAIGDAIAQTTLAEVLLRLNVGLVGIITSFLRHAKHDLHLDYTALATLADRSRVDTCKALRQLYRRLTALSPPAPIPPLAITSREHVESAGNSALSSNSRKRSKARTPMLAQVVIQDSSKPPQLAMVRPAERRKKNRSSSGSDESSKSSSHMNAVQTAPPQYTSIPTTPDLGVQRTRPAPASAQAAHRAHRKQSSPNVRTINSNGGGYAGQDALRATRSTPRLRVPLAAAESLLAMPNPNTAYPAPAPGPPPFPVSAPPPASVSTPALLARRQRKPTPTYYSTATDHTRLGEIPLHEWAVPYDFDEMSLVNREAYQNGWPYRYSNGTEAEQGRQKKRAGFWGLFGRR